MINLPLTRPCQICAIGLLFTLAAGCSALRPTAVEQPAFYSLDNVRSETRAITPATAAAALPLAEPTLIVNPPRAAPGFSSQRIVYVREAHQLEYYAHSEWVDSPARMIAPLIVTAIGNSGSFRAAVLTPSAANADLRLDTEIVRLQHDLSSKPSGVRFSLRATIVDNTTRKVLARSEFDETIASTSEDPYGGVIAANRAVQVVLEQLVEFCTETAAHWQPASAQN